MSKISKKIEQVRERIALACEHAGRDADEVELIIVTKSAGLKQIKEVIRLGITELAESRAQQLKKVAEEVEEFLAKSDKDSGLPSKVNWHMVGHLQRNKVAQVLPIASMTHSVDTLRLAEEISSSAQKLDIFPEILLQVNSSGEPQKFGVPVGAATHLAEQIVTLPNLKLVGLMTMAALTKNKDKVRICFSRTRELFEEIQSLKIAGNEFVNLSMGMSHDFELAIEEGATMVRIGSAIFG